MEPVKEVIREYLRMKEELEDIRKQFLLSLSRKDDKGARTYGGILKDYRGIQVKLLQTLSSLGVKQSEDDLAKLLSGLPEVTCDINNCPCAYHKSIKKIVEDTEEEQEGESKGKGQ